MPAYTHLQMIQHMYYISWYQSLPVDISCLIFRDRRSTIFLGPSPPHLHNEAESLEELEDEFDGNLPIHLPPLDWGANVPVEAGLQLQLVLCQLIPIQRALQSLQLW